MAITHFVWDSVNDSYLMEKDQTGATVVEYTAEPLGFGNLISQRHHNSTNYFHFDAQKATKNLTDSGQGVSDQYLYSAFGRSVATSGVTENSFKFGGAIGYYEDDTENTLYVRRRIYDPDDGRWRSPDPHFALEMFRASTYAYVRNAPVAFVDPTGLIPFGTQPAQRTCVFQLSGGGPSTLEGVCKVYPSTVGIVNPVYSTVAILKEIWQNKCCNIVLFGHQGADRQYCGGMVIWPKGHSVGNPIPVFPDTGFEQDLNALFTKTGCPSCSITMYACSCPDELRRTRVRQSIAYNTGCRVSGTVPKTNFPPGISPPVNPFAVGWQDPNTPGIWGGYSLTSPPDPETQCWGLPELETFEPGDYAIWAVPFIDPARV